MKDPEARSSQLSASNSRLKQSENGKLQKQTVGNKEEINEWKTAMGSGKRIKNKPKQTTVVRKGTGNPPKENLQTLKMKKAKIKIPRSAAVVITPNAEKGITRTEILKEARSKIKIEDLGIQFIRPKIAATGAVILEIPGETGATKADGLASRLREVIGKDRAKIARPVKKADLRITGLDESVTAQEIASSMATVGGCLIEECRIGMIRYNTMGIGTVWANCPATAAKKLADAMTLMVGWVRAKVVALSPRPLICYKCLEPGHTRAKCVAPVDRGGLCYRCGNPGHIAKGCIEKPRCPLCLDAGRPADHTLGSAACTPPQRRKKPQNDRLTPQGKTVPGTDNQGNKDEACVSKIGEKESMPLPRRVPKIVQKSTKITQERNKEQVDEDVADNSAIDTSSSLSPSLLLNKDAPEEAMDTTQ